MEKKCSPFRATISTLFSDCQKRSTHLEDSLKKSAIATDNESISVVTADLVHQFSLVLSLDRHLRRTILEQVSDLHPPGD